jgi:hypothetical protein
MVYIVLLYLGLLFFLLSYILLNFQKVPGEPFVHLTEEEEAEVESAFNSNRYGLIEMFSVIEMGFVVRVT